MHASNKCASVPSDQRLCNSLSGKYKSQICNTQKVSNSYIMGCPPVRGDNPRVLGSGLSYAHVNKHGINTSTSVKTLHITGHFVLKLVKVV